MTGKVAIVSGSNTGIGNRTAYHIAATGITLIMACRSMERGEEAKRNLEKELTKDGITNFDIKVMQMDLRDPASIRSFAKAFQSKYKKLDILVNNAGTNIPGLSDKGLDFVYTVSYLGHFFLTTLLYDTIKKTPGARVVNVSSLLHRYGTLQYEAAASGKRGSDQYFNALANVYCDSKLSMMIFTQELRSRMAQDGANFNAFAVSPGNVKSDIWRAVPILVRIPLDLAARVAFLSTEQGCHTSVMAALAPLEELSTDGEPALYLQPYKGPVQRRPFDCIGPFAGTVKTKACLPPDIENEGKRLWETSLNIIKSAENGTLRPTWG